MDQEGLAGLEAPPLDHRAVDREVGLWQAGGLDQGEGSRFRKALSDLGDGELGVAA